MTGRSTSKTDLSNAQKTISCSKYESRHDKKPRLLKVLCDV